MINHQNLGYPVFYSDKPNWRSMVSQWVQYSAKGWKSFRLFEHIIYIYMYMYCICCISSMTYMDLSKNGVPLVVHCAPHFPCPLSTKIARAWGKIPWFSQRKWAAQRRRRSWGSLRVPSFGIDSYPPEQSSTGWALLKNWGVLKSWGIPKSSPWLFQY